MKNRTKMEKYFLSVLLINCLGFTQCNILDTASSWVHSVTDSTSSYYCNMFECCNEKTVPYNIKNLQTMLRSKLYGQHIAAEVVLNAINSHVKKSKPKKPLVMSFHGANGVGKTYVSRMIAKAFYEKGENSKFFHFFYGLESFPLTDKMAEYQIQLKYDIEAAIHACERSLFVFDGVDQMPPGLLNVLMPFIDCPNCAGKEKKNKSIFIFLTNTGSLAIQQQLLNKLREGIKRERTALQDFEKIIIAETFNRTGGLFKSLMIKSDAIDFYVPFLPLEKHHVEYCIKEAFEDLDTAPTKDLINEVFEELRFGPEPDNLFSNSGCKRVAQIAGRISVKMSLDLDSFDNEIEHKDEL